MGALFMWLRGSSSFRAATGRGIGTARIVWGLSMAVVAWSTWAPAGIAGLVGLGFYVGAMDGWHRSLSLGRYEDDRPAFGAVMRHAARGLVFPFFGAALVVVGGRLLGQDVGLHPVFMALSGLACVPAYEIGWRWCPRGSERWPGATVVGEILFGAVMGASVGAGGLA